MKHDLQTHMDSYLSYCLNTRCLSSKTIKGYRDVFRQFRAVMPEIKTTDQITPETIDNFYLRLRHRPKRVGSTIVEAGLQASTLRAYGVKLRAFFGWLCERGHLTTNPIVKKSLPKAVHDDKRALTRTQIEKIFGAVTQHVHNLLLFKRDLAMLHVLLFCGLRKNELASLRVMDINLADKLLMVACRTSKSEYTRTLTMNPVTAVHLEEYLTERRKHKINCEYLWVNVRGERFTEHGLSHWVKKLRVTSGVRFHLHQFRHSFACMLGRRNVSAVNARLLLGHANLQMTETYMRSLGFQDTGKNMSVLSFDDL